MSWLLHGWRRHLRIALRWAGASVALVVVSAIMSVLIAVTFISWQSTAKDSLESWLQAAARSSDSIEITYGHPDLVERSGLEPAYGHLWTLPMRVLDPNLRQLGQTLEGVEAPTWVVEWTSFDGLGNANANSVRSAIASNYRLVANVCGYAIYLIDGARRDLPFMSSSCDESLSR